jgi:hypothetical protein
MQTPTTYRWEELVKRQVKCTDGADLGDIKATGPRWVMTEKVNEKEMERFYLPKYLVKGFNGKEVEFNVTEEQAEKDFMKPTPPAPGEYEIYNSPETAPGLETSVPRI